MNSPSSHSVCIDAASNEAADLLHVVSQLLFATQRAHHGITDVTVFIPAEDQTDWPDTEWLHFERVPTASSARSKDASHAPPNLEKHLQKNPDCILLSLNTPRASHPASIVLVSDFAAARFGGADQGGNILHRIRKKIDTRSLEHDLQEVNAIVGFSCYAVAQLSAVQRETIPRLNVVPMGIDPMFFGPGREHRMVDSLTTDTPFEWLSAFTHDSADATASIITAIKTLRELGAYVKLKLLMPDIVGGHRVSKDLKSRIEKLLADNKFVEVVHDCSPGELVQHYSNSDGFIWGQRADRHYQFLLYAMARGLPIVAAHSEMIKKHLGSKVRFFMSDDADDLASTLERSMADIHFRIISGTRNHKRSMSYTWEKTAAELFRLLRAYGTSPTESAVMAS